MTELRECASHNCTKLFEPKQAHQKYCSVKCRWRSRYRRRNPIKTFKCEWCGEDFVPRSNNQTSYCCDICASEANAINSKKRNFKLSREFPELFYNKLGSKYTTERYELYKHKNGKPNFQLEEDWVKKERKRLGI